MTDAIVAADRRYNSKEVLDFLSNVLGISLIGTHKRDLSYPYVFGDGAIRARHRGIVVSEWGCRAVYNARLKTSSAVNNGRTVEAVLYRESCSGRIASKVVNNPRLFRSRGLTVAPYDRFRRDNEGLHDVVIKQTIFDAVEEVRSAPRHTGVPHSAGRTAVEHVLNKVVMLTFYQSEDPVWFLLRAFKFTSRTSYGFLQAVAGNYEASIEGLSHLLAGRTISSGAEPFPDDSNACKIRVNGRFDIVFGALGVQKRRPPAQLDSASLKEAVLSMSRSRIAGERGDALIEILEKLDRMPQVQGRLLKRHLVDALVQAQDKLRTGQLVVPQTHPADTNEEECWSSKSVKLIRALQEASLQAWVMKPLVSTVGMKEGSLNEVYVLQALPEFFTKTECVYRRNEQSSPNSAVYSRVSGHEMNVSFIRATGLVCDPVNTMLADSPDALCGIYFGELKGTHPAAIEVKTMTAPKTLEYAKLISSHCGPLIVVSDIEGDAEDTELFEKVVPSSKNRAQRLHHAAVLGVRQVVYVVGKGGRAAIGGIICAAVLEFKSLLLHQYTWCLAAVEQSAFFWIGLKPEEIPREYDTLLKKSYASDLHSFASYYSISLGIIRLIQKRGLPLPPSRMIRLTPAVFWNQAKGDVDEVSRILKTLSGSNTSENPVVSIIARLLTTQVNNGAVMSRLSVAERKGLLKESHSHFKGQKGYSNLRHRVSQCDTFGRFARQLAKEWVKHVSQGPDGIKRIGDKAIMKPAFARRAAERYNLRPAKVRRLNENLAHDLVSANRAYCVLCSYTVTHKERGKEHNKKFGSHGSQWCSTCRQPICENCWETWHSVPVLKRRQATDEQRTEFAARFTRRTRGRNT